jgi:hypothetical protein
MREETIQIETVLGGTAERLERAGGLPLSDALRLMHVVRTFMRNCVEAGCEEDLILSMERAGLSDLNEALLPMLRR